MPGDAKVKTWPLEVRNGATAAQALPSHDVAEAEPRIWELCEDVRRPILRRTLSLTTEHFRDRLFRRRSPGRIRSSQHGRPRVGSPTRCPAKSRSRGRLIFTDKASGAKRDRPGLDACFRVLRSGDILLVWRLDRLGRSVHHLVTLIDQLQNLGVGFRSVCDGAIDTTTPSGELIFHIFSSLAQFERRLIQERTKAGLAAARARGARVVGPH